jgi:hypothetical protein
MDRLTTGTLEQLATASQQTGPALRAPTQQVVTEQSIRHELERIVDGQIDYNHVLAASLERHPPPPAAAEAKAGPSDSAVASSDAIVSDSFFAVLVSLMRTHMMLAIHERDQRAAATDMRVAEARAAGSERVASANAALAGSFASFAMVTAVGAAGTVRAVQSNRVTAKSVQDNVVRANDTDLNVRSNQANATTGAAAASMRPERTIVNQQGQSVRVPSDRDGATEAMREVAESQPRLPEVASANAAHMINSARAQTMFAQSQLVNLMAVPLGGFANSIGQLEASTHDAKRMMHEANADLAQQRASERGEQISQDRQRQEAVMTVLQTIARNNNNTADQIVGNM